MHSSDNRSNRGVQAGSSGIDTRTRLLEAAGPVFAARGFDDATVREICSAANVNIALVAYHFGDKLGLYREVIEGIRRSRQQRFPAPDNDCVNPRQMLFELVRTMLTRMLATDAGCWETQLLLREMHHPTPVFENIVRDFFRPLFDRLCLAIQRLLGTPAPEHVIQQLALSVVGQCLYYRVGSGVVELLIPANERQQHYDIDSLSRHITAVMLSATADGAVVHQRTEIDLADRLSPIFNNN